MEQQDAGIFEITLRRVPDGEGIVRCRLTERFGEVADGRNVLEFDAHFAQLGVTAAKFITNNMKPPMVDKQEIQDKAVRSLLYFSLGLMVAGFMAALIR